MLAVVFDSVGFGEWFVLLAVVLIFVGPKKLPSAARTIGNYYARFRRAAEGFKRQLMDMETEFDKAASEAEKQVEGAFSSGGDESKSVPAGNDADDGSAAFGDAYASFDADGAVPDPGDGGASATAEEASVPPSAAGGPASAEDPGKDRES